MEDFMIICPECDTQYDVRIYVNCPQCEAIREEVIETMFDESDS